MEIVFGIACATFIILIGYHCMKESDSQRRFKEKQAARMQDIQAERARQTAAAYERHRTPRSAPVTTGKPTTAPVTTRVADVKRRDNSFENVVDSYEAPTYHSSHSTSSHSSHSCSSSSSSSSDSSSSSSDSGGGCD